MPEKEVDIAEYLKLFLRYKYLILATLIVFASIGFLFYKYEVPVYTSTAYLELGVETVAKSYDIGNVQEVSTITTMATSYPFVYRVASNLELSNYPIKLTILEKLFSTQSLRYLNSSELVYYYMDNIRVSQRGGTRNIIEITATSQDRKLAADIANEVGRLVIEDNIKEKEQLLQKSTDFIDKQLDSLAELMQTNRREIEQIELSPTYSEVVKIKDKLTWDQSTLTLFLRERENLMATLALDIASSELKTANEEKLDYVQKRIAELEITIEDAKKRLTAIDKTDFYKLQNLQFAVDTDAKIYQDLISQKQQIVLADLINTKNVRFLSRAYQPIYADKTKGLITILVFIAMGALFAFGAIQLLEIMSRRFKSSKDVEETLGLKVIGNIPVLSKEDEFKLITPKQHPRSSIVEAYRTLATNIKFATKSKHIKSIAFTSDKAKTGKSYTAVNLGVVMADTGDKILLVDVDLRRPNLHKMFKLERKPGLTDVLAGKSSLKDALHKVRDNLYILPAGSLNYNPQNIIESDAMKKFIKDVKGLYDYIFFDSIPLTTFSESVILASETDASLLVMDERRSEKDTMEFAKERLEDAGSNILGISINRTKRRYAKYYYQYYYHYHEKGGESETLKDKVSKTDKIELNKSERAKIIKERRERLAKVGKKIKSVFLRKKSK